jgi:hypothetical protein
MARKEKRTKEKEDGRKRRGSETEHVIETVEPKSKETIVVRP